MATLMTLPLEIREVIFSYIILSDRPAPKHSDPINLSRTSLNRMDIYEFVRRSAIADPIYVKYPTYQLPHPAHALLLLNQQTHHEAKNIWRRLTRSQVNHVDISFIDEHECWISFLSIYNPSKRFDTVRTQVRPLQDLKGNSIWKTRPWRREWFYETFEEVFFEFLQTGPLLEHDAKNTWIEERSSSKRRLDRQITVSTLEIDVITPGDRHCVLSSPEVDGERFEAMCYYAVALIESTLQYAYHYRHDGFSFHERIGEVKVFFKGKLHAHLDLGEKLAASHTNDRTFADIQNFYIWRASIIAKRRENGLSIVVEDTPSSSKISQAEEIYR